MEFAIERVDFEIVGDVDRQCGIRIFRAQGAPRHALEPCARNARGEFSRGANFN